MAGTGSRCPTCGNPVEAYSTFCGVCGTQLEWDQPPTGARGRGRVVAIVAGVVVVAVAAAAIVVLTGGKAEAKEVLLQSKAAPGPDPFTPDITPDPPAEGKEAPRIQAVPKVTAVVDGKSTELYGGSGKLSQCAKQKLIAFLQENPAKARAWAEVQGITPDRIPAFIRSLLPAELVVDTRVTNHSFRDGKAVPLQSVLEAGTAVLVDDEGHMRVRCKCGNPLLPPEKIEEPEYVGDDIWPDFDPDKVAEPPPVEPTTEPSTAGPTGDGDEYGVAVAERFIVFVGARSDLEFLPACDVDPARSCDETIETDLMIGPFPTLQEAVDAFCAAIVPGSVQRFDDGVVLATLDTDGAQYDITNAPACEAPPGTSAPTATA